MQLTNLQLHSMLICCSAVLLHDFGEGGYITEPYDKNWEIPVPPERDTIPSGYGSLNSFKEDLLRAMKSYDSCYRDEPIKSLYTNRCLAKMALVVGFVTNCQPKAVEYLTELGFTLTPFVEKLKHRNNKLSMFSIPARTLIQNVGYKPDHENIGKGLI